MKRAAGLIAIVFGGLLLVLAVCLIGLSFYYRPTIEYAYTAGRESPLRGTTELWLVYMALAAIGAALLWSGRRLRRHKGAPR